ASKSLFCRVSAVVATACAASLLLGALITRSAGGWLIDGYLCFFGLNLMALSITMLSGEGAASRLASSFNLDKAVLR
ncbi:MAG: hypothetical protein V4555_01975, partial [Acidobacteriota bacterium]